MFSVDFDRIVTDGEKCSDQNVAKDRMIAVGSQPSISSLTKIPTIKTLDLATLFSGKDAGASAAGKEAQIALDAVLKSDASFVVGVDLAPRTCGDVETPANTPYLFIAPKNDIVINAAAKPPVALKAGVDNMVSVNKEALCVYSRKRTKAAKPVKDTLDKIKDVASCFPADATVTLAAGGRKRMDAVRVGDVVLAAPGVYSPVFALTHADAGATAEFARLCTCCGECLRLTPGHYIHANGGLVAAGAVRVGDEVVGASGMRKKIVSVGREEGTGLYNPQTLHGDVVVDGILSSTYTTAVEAGVAHGLLTPVRKVYEWTGFGPSLDYGADVLAGVVGGAAVLSE